MFWNFFKKNKIRVRIAPSPTGFLHMGTARTALFNWLFAKSQGGKFILRIEDTDLERSEKRFEEDIISGLKWLGLEWDEGPYRQSERLDIYEKYIKKLLDKGGAYYCACTKEELEKEKQIMEKAGEAPRYSGKCRDKNIPPEKSQIIRFKMPEEKISFGDIIRGEISFDAKLMGDIAIAKNLKTPLYNFAVVVDDYEMKISHVIRGEDHIANTPKQIALQKALGFDQPKYAHLPLILDPDRSKMSKRHSATSVQEYKKMGYLPEALFNFIALLGWHPKDEKEIFDKNELAKEFDISRVQKAGAVFDIEKLNWLNSQYIKNYGNEKIFSALREIFGDKIKESPLTEKLITLSKDRLKKLGDFMEINDFFFGLPEYDASLLIWKNSTKEKTVFSLNKVFELLDKISESEFTEKNLESALMQLANAEIQPNGKTDRGAVLWPLRASLSGKEKSPGPFEILDILGKAESLWRINSAIQKLSKLP